ncbi:MAG: ABC transporter ATP-binding protein [Clostridia bacterium]|jgi:osmoprotectant transport system ATP-binding protein|nr:ABC transporter ATP-binding protein [Clostridia bacterium]
MADTIIRFEKVSKKYNSTPVLNNISFTIKKKEFITIIGSSGCGKTTVLKLINGLLFPDSGKIYVQHEDISKVNQIALRRKIGYVIQGIGLFPHMTVSKNIAYVPSLTHKWDKKTEKDTVKLLLEIVGLEEEMAGRYPHELSGGQQQRVGIARALAAKPEILLMDEPFGAVDEITRRALQDQILLIQEKIGITVVFITHDINEALKLGSRVMVLDNGGIVQLATPQEIYENPATDFVRKLVGNY